MKVAAYEDVEGESYDRFTVCYLDQPTNPWGMVEAVGMSDDPFHPLGFGQHTEAEPGPHLGKRIRFKDLPEPCRRMVATDAVSISLEEGVEDTPLED